MLGTGRGDCDELQAKGTVIAISGFLTGFYVKITWKSYKKKAMETPRLHPRPKKLDFLGPGSGNLYFYHVPQVILIPDSGRTIKFGKL